MTNWVDDANKQLNRQLSEDMALGWDSEISKESSFEPFPPGDYKFKVIEFERSRHEGSEKLPPCPKAIVHLEIEDSKHETRTIKHNLFLHTKTEGMLSNFFIGIGQKKKGEAFRPNWQSVVGSTGRCKIGINRYTSNGVEYVNNDVKKFYEKTEEPKANFTAGAF